jgi:hypothetical protein
VRNIDANYRAFDFFSGKISQAGRRDLPRRVPRDVAGWSMATRTRVPSGPDLVDRIDRRGRVMVGKRKRGCAARLNASAYQSPAPRRAAQP